jgi:hypothetical protein
MSMDRRAISRQYKERKLHGGVYTITNTATCGYLLGHAADLASIQNRFAFAVTTGSAVDPRLREDWAALGGQAFRFDVLEELDQGPEQTQAAFLEDLRTLETLWREKLDPATTY